MVELDLLDLIEHCYGCVAAPELWLPFLATCARTFGAAASSIATMPVRGGLVGWSVVHGLDAAQIQELIHWAPRDPRATVYAALEPGQPFNFDEQWDVESFRQSRYFTEYQHKLDLLWAVIARLDDGRDLDGLWALHRPERTRPFDAATARAVGVLARHIGRARRLQLDLDGALERAAVAQRQLDRLPCGLVLLDAQGRVAELNKAASSMLAAGDGLSLHGRQITLADPDSQKKFTAACRAASKGLLDGVGGVVSVPRPSGQADYVVSVARCVAELSRHLGARATVVITIADSARGTGLAPATLRHLWDLTAAEAQLALALAEGVTLENIAARSGISLHTARVHLKRILHKSKTHRQSELVRLILTGPGAMP